MWYSTPWWYIFAPFSIKNLILDILMVIFWNFFMHILESKFFDGFSPNYLHVQIWNKIFWWISPKLFACTDLKQDFLMDFPQIICMYRFEIRFLDGFTLNYLHVQIWNEISWWISLKLLACRDWLYACIDWFWKFEMVIEIDRKWNGREYSLYHWQFLIFCSHFRYEIVL